MTASSDGPLVGQSVARPDERAKAAGRHELGADLATEDMLWAAIVRSPHPHAAITQINRAPALTMPGVHAVITHADVDGPAGVATGPASSSGFGLERADQPVLASDVVRYVGEPVAAVAADRPDLARAAAAAIEVTYEVLPTVTDLDEATHAAAIHPDGNVIRHIVVRRGDAEARGEVVVEGSYEIDPAVHITVDPVAGLAQPVGEGGVELSWPSLAPERDHASVATSLGLQPAQIRYVPAGVGGEHGPRHDVGIQAALCALALRVRRPVKIVLSDAEGQLQRSRPHPARLWYRHHASLNGTLVRVDARLVFDSGAYATTSASMLAAACAVAAGPYVVPHARIEGVAVRTNRPPAGGSRGDGALQVCFAYEAQMDKLASVLGLDPIQLRLRNAVAPGDELVTGQRVTAPAPVAELIEACSTEALPARHRVDRLDNLPGEAGRASQRAAVRRGVGIAVGVSGVLAAEGAAGAVSALVRLDAGGATVACDHHETGQGFITAVHQIVRDLLDVQRVVLEPLTVTAPTHGPYWLAGRGLLALEAVAEACRLVEKKRSGDDAVVEASATVAYPTTTGLDIDGQGEPCGRLAFAAYRAVVDVDVELGLVRVADMTLAQHAGHVLNPRQVRTQLEAGITLGIRTALDAGGPVDSVDRSSSWRRDTSRLAGYPAIRLASLRTEPDPAWTLGAISVTDLPIAVSPAAVAAAIRDAVGVAIVKLPARPEHIAAVPRS